MGNTLYDKMLAESEMYISPEMSQRHAEILAKSCTNQAIQAQIDLLEKMRIKVTNGNPENIVESVDRALYEEIQELEKKIA